VTGDLPPPDQLDADALNAAIIERIKQGLELEQTPDKQYQRKVGPMLTSEREHIKKFGQEKFQKRLVLANMCCRQDTRFTGMDKIRSQIAFQAALQATGYEQRTLKLIGCGPTEGIGQRAADELFARAIEAARASS